MNSKNIENKERRIDNLFKLNFSYEEMVRELTLSNEDRDKSLTQKKDYNRVAYATQILLLKSKCIIINNLKSFREENKEIFEYICKQVNVDTDVDISKYCNKTYLRHRAEILKCTKYKQFKETSSVKKNAFNIAMSTSSKFEMMRDFIKYLRDNDVILPARSRIEKIIDNAINDSNDYIYKEIANKVKNKKLLEDFVLVKDSRLTDFNFIKNNKHRRANDIKRKIEILNSYEVDINLGKFHVSKREELYKKVENIKREDIIRLKSEHKRIAYIAIFIESHKKKLIDELIIFKRKSEIESASKKGINKIVVKAVKDEKGRENLRKTYDRFKKMVVLNFDKENEGEYIDAFINILFGACSGYMYKRKENIYVLKSNNKIQLNIEEYKRFKREVISTYTNKEKREITANIDRLVSKEYRKNKGRFYTPDAIVQHSHAAIIQEFGYTWYDDFAVIDCACGTLNLTKDYNYKELYCSTLEMEELEVSKEYNTNACKFIYNFLEKDDDNNKLDVKLIDRLKKGGKIMFFINPPYKSVRGNMEQTYMGLEMESEELGDSSKQLITQFLYKIIKIKELYKLEDIKICLISDIGFMRRKGFKKFREKFLNEFSFKNGLIFKSELFSDISKEFGISLSIWESSKCSSNKSEFKHSIIDIDNNVSDRNIKVICNDDNSKQSIKSWCTDKECKKEEIVGYFKLSTNEVRMNIYCDIDSIDSSKSIAITKRNIRKVACTYAAKKILDKQDISYINRYDNYSVPEVNHWKYNHFAELSLTYTMFNDMLRGKLGTLEDDAFRFEKFINKINKRDDISEVSILLKRIVRKIQGNDIEWTEDIQQIYENIENEIKPLVYALGFLK